MMKKFLSMAALAACVTITSCSNDDEVPTQEVAKGTPLNKVEVGINTIQSRAGIFATNFSSNESIGLFLYKQDAFGTGYNTGSSATTVAPENIKYDRHENEGWWTSQNPIILTSTKGNLFAYYPYAAGNTNGSAVAVNVAANQGTGISDGLTDAKDALGNVIQADYMWSVVGDNDSWTAIDNNTTQVTFKMNHALAMVTFKFVRDTYPGDAVIQKIEMTNPSNGQYLKVGAGTMNLGDKGAITANTAGSIACEPMVALADVNSPAELPHMLVYPTSADITEGDVLLNVTMDGKIYQIPLPTTLMGTGDNYKFEAGKNYVYTLKLKGHGFGADDEDGRDDITVQITEWDQKEVSEGTMSKPIN